MLHYFTYDRAIYHDSNIYMLDDVLSAVDAQVGRWVLHNAIQGPLMEKKTRILCTHNVQVILLNSFKFLLDIRHLLLIFVCT